MGIPEALQTVQNRIKEAAAKSGRNPDDIKLVVVSKTIGLQRIIEAIQAGEVIFGENRVQEAREKIAGLEREAPALTGMSVQWHLIGHLQKNKARTAVRLFNLIQTVDSSGLAEEINSSAMKNGKIQEILVQVKLSDEEAKHGVPEKELLPLLEKIGAMDHLRFRGLMTMPPFSNDPDESRPYFRRLKELSYKIDKEGFPVNVLSMGMSNDFEVGIEEGATMVRVGSAIFGQRRR